MQEKEGKRGGELTSATSREIPDFTGFQRGQETEGMKRTPGNPGGTAIFRCGKGEVMGEGAALG